MKFTKEQNFLNYTTYQDYEKLPVLRHSRHAFEDLEIFFLGLPTVGLGKGQNILLGEARRKKAQFFPFLTLGTWPKNLSYPQANSRAILLAIPR